MRKRITCLLSGIFIITISAVSGQTHRTKPGVTPVTSFTATPQIVCACGTVQFTDQSTNGPSSWKWYFQGGNPSTSTVQNPSVIYCMPGTYAVAEVATNGSGSDSIYVAGYITVEPLPNLVVTPASGGLCTGGIDSVCFTVSGASIYTWAPTGAANGMGCAACPDPCVSPTVTTEYTVTGTSAGGCIATYVDTVYVGKITAKITGKDSICVGKQDTLNGSGGSTDGSTTYIWSNGHNGTSIVVSPTVTTIYTLTITQAPMCTSQTTFTVSPYPTPQFVLGGSDSVCKGECTNLTISPTGNGFNQAWWSDGFVDTMTNSFTYCPPATGTINLLVRNGGCYLDTNIKIKVSTLNSVTFTGATNLCQGSSTEICIHGGTQYQYHWSTGATTSCVTVEPYGDITYTVGITDGACYKDTTFTIIVDTMPKIKFKGDTSICTGDSTTLYAFGGLTYSWTTGSTADSIKVGPITTTSYTLTVTKGACSKDTTVRVKVYGHPHGKTYTTDSCICQFDSIHLMVTGGDYYLWSPRNSGLEYYKQIPANDTAINIASPNISTKYTIQVCTWGCCDTVYDSVCVNPGAIATLTASDTTVSSGTPVILTATPGNGQTSITSWIGPNLSSNTGNTVTATPQVTSTYYVLLVNHSTGCTYKDSIVIDIFNCTVFVPSIFSPSQEVNNELYVDSYCIKTMDFAVYDRWGNKVWETTTPPPNTPTYQPSHTPGSGWNGTYHGKPMDMGTYVWYLNAVELDGTFVNTKGNVTLIR